MKEFAELRVRERFAKLLFRDDEGVRLGTSVRKIVLDTSDPRFQELPRLDAYCHKNFDTYFFAGWQKIYRYTKQEVAEAKLFHLNITKMFEPAGEECGTTYSSHDACGKCHTGAQQTSPLRLRRIRLSDKVVIARSIADEWLIRRDMVRQLEKVKVSGLVTQPIDSSRSSSRGAPAFEANWVQLRDKPELVDFHEDTRIGIDLINLDPPPYQPEHPDWVHRCAPHLAGLNLVSPVTIKRKSWGGADIVFSSAMVGTRRGLLRPARLILVSPRFAQVLRDVGGTGYRLDIAYLK